MFYFRTKVHFRCSGTVPVNERPGFKKLVQKMRASDELHVYKLDRLSRRARDLKDVIRMFSNEDVKVLASDVPQLADVPDSMRDLVNDIMISILSFTAETEREFIKERQRKGIENAKKKGVYKGRPFKYSADSNDVQGRMIYEMILKDLKDRKTIKGTARKYHVGNGVVQRIKKEMEIDLNE
ncbi:TPA: recombinase family protein [Staphylococcus aureus]|uniref:Resolvase/invertase-type recombinase catalytic domain-containing protein n=2 Tax=Staphylococcus aureus TaxID=1280 RepID=A0A1D0BS42_STAAU|nr:MULTISPECIES: recombinase family protein [Staphylococcaceae]EZR57573.1 hypothetical protein W712_02565 [Staphylococcus aureus VET1858R]EZR61412.1 hypothetical protein W693_02732 [Staphylococcus aureus VET1833R]EZT82167.1 hypothetical protein U927_02558 [Staphylococcus aureus 12S00972]EZT86668.1 hypothetical protein U922_02615 [Staphylococcus aureus 11S01420]EZU65494.1 hypothetical protein U988_02565 [Staphylococcus aureus 1111000175]